MLSANFPLIISDLDQSGLLKRIINYSNSIYSAPLNEQSVLDLNFSQNKFSIVEEMGATDKSISDILTTTRNTTATYTSALGTVLSRGVNLPRVNFDSVTAKNKGLLIERSTTNVLAHSSNYLDANWSKDQITISNSAVLSPDGITNAQFMAENTNTSLHYLSRNAVPISTTMTVSTYVKSEGRDWCLLRLEELGTQNIRGHSFNLVTGEIVNPPTLTSGTGASSYDTFIEFLPNGWRRIGFTVNFPTLPTQIRYRVYARTDTNTTYTGDPTKGYYLWGSQVESNAVSTSFVPTTASAVSRVVDGYSLTLPVTTEGTIFVIASGSNLVPTESQTIFKLSDGTLNNYIALRRNSGISGTDFTVVSGGIIQAQAFGSQKTKAQRNKYAISWKNGQFFSVEDGNVIVENYSGVAPANLSKLGIGSDGVDFSFNNALNGTIERLVFIPRSLSLLELQTLTQ